MEANPKFNLFEWLRGAIGALAYDIFLWSLGLDSNEYLCNVEGDAREEITRLQSALAAAMEDAERLADELKIVLLKTGVVWEEAGENSPALIIHNNLIREK